MGALCSCERWVHLLSNNKTNFEGSMVMILSTRAATFAGLDSDYHEMRRRQQSIHAAPNRGAGFLQSSNCGWIDVEDSDAVLGLEEVAGHVRTHVTKANEADVVAAQSRRGEGALDRETQHLWLRVRKRERGLEEEGRRVQNVSTTREFRGWLPGEVILPPCSFVGMLPHAGLPQGAMGCWSRRCRVRVSLSVIEGAPLTLPAALSLMYRTKRHTRGRQRGCGVLMPHGGNTCDALFLAGSPCLLLA